MHKPNEINIERHGTLVSMVIKGDITSFSEPYLNQAYEDVDLQHAPEKILLVFEKDAYINSGGIAVLIQILARTRKKDQRIGITGINSHFKKIFNMVGITKLATIYDTLDVALATLETLK
jgi:anti-anti-sigma factor